MGRAKVHGKALGNSPNSGVHRFSGIFLLLLALTHGKVVFKKEGELSRILCQEAIYLSSLPGGNGAGSSSLPIWLYSGRGLPCLRPRGRSGELLPRRFTLPSTQLEPPSTFGKICSVFYRNSLLFPF